MSNVLMEMSPETKAQFDALKASNEELARKLAAAEEQRQADLAEGRKRLEAAMKNEAAAHINALRSATDLRFGKEALDAYADAYTAAKVASISDNEQLREFAAKQVAALETIAAGKLPVAPGGKLPDAQPVPGADAPPTKKDFEAAFAGDREAAARVDAYVQKLAAKDGTKTLAQHRDDAYRLAV